jgi:type IV secretory pathway VirB4 component
MEYLNSKNKKSPEGMSTQKYVDVEEIRDGVIVLKNRSLRSILLVSSINFDLKSTEEQDAIIQQYQSFLNSIDFPAQILINSRRLNVEPYLDFLEEKEKKQTNELLRLQIGEYRNFIKNLTEVSNIMSKSFYIVVPFSPIENKEGGVFSKLSAMFAPKQEILKKRESFETYKNQLWQRVDHIISGLSGIGLKIVPLETQEIIELLYNSYNPNVYKSVIIKEVEKIELEKM